MAGEIELMCRNQLKWSGQIFPVRSLQAIATDMLVSSLKHQKTRNRTYDLLLTGKRGALIGLPTFKSLE